MAPILLFVLLLIVMAGAYAYSKKGQETPHPNAPIVKVDVQPASHPALKPVVQVTVLPPKVMPAISAGPAIYQKGDGYDYAFGHMGPGEYGRYPYAFLGNVASEKECQNNCTDYASNKGEKCEAYTYYDETFQLNPNIRGRCFTAPAKGHSNRSFAGAHSALRLN